MKRFDNQKTKRLEKLTKKDQEDLIFDLINALVKAQNLEDAALFLQDLLTRKEAQVLSKRLRIAKLLLSGKTYEQIEKQVHVSHGTIAKIGAWLAERGDGFRNTIQKLPKKQEQIHPFEESDWTKFKRRHTLYFWPELLLEEIVKSANRKQKERIKNVLDRLDEKSELHKRIESFISKV